MTIIDKITLICDDQDEFNRAATMLDKQGLAVTDPPGAFGVRDDDDQALTITVTISPVARLVPVTGAIQ